MGNWFLVRHGETEWNRTGRIHGHSDIPLSEHGERQVKMLATRIASQELCCAYASDLMRATETARILTGRRAMATETDSALREFFYGAWEGLTLEEVEGLCPSMFADKVSLGEDSFAAPRGEGTAELLERVRRFCTRVLKHHDPAANVLIVAHAGSIRALLVSLLGLPDDHFWRFKVDCAGLSILGIHPGGNVVELWNDTSHLTGTAQASKT